MMGHRDNERLRCLVAMSGGVDSAVAAARLVDRGHEVIGVTLHLWDYPDDGPAKSRCCAPEDVHDARRVADWLGIAHYTFDQRELFAREVIAPFVDGYLQGLTPSPCVQCNRRVKMTELLRLAERLGAQRVATGHYAQVQPDDHGMAQLVRGRDHGKDQSYFLYMLNPSQLERLVLPLGDSTKTQVRAEAVARRLPAAHKGESQELCFVPDGDYAAFVQTRAPGRVRPGRIVDQQGHELGQHAGVHRFTVGQRRGLGVTANRPLFVTRIDAEHGAVVVGDAEQARADRLTIEAASWHPHAKLPLRAEVKVRARHRPAAAHIEPLDDEQARCLICFDEPVPAVAPGQIAVAFDGERVLGGGTIVAAGADATHHLDSPATPSPCRAEAVP